MSRPMDTIDVTRLGIEAAHELAPLIAAYAQDQRRGAPREPDQYYAELLLEDKTAEILGARIEGRLVGFAVYFDLPVTMDGRRVGELSDLFVIQDARGRSIGQALVKALAGLGATRGWSELRWVVPEKPASARKLAERLARRTGAITYTIDLAHK